MLNDKIFLSRFSFAPLFLFPLSETSLPFGGETQRGGNTHPRKKNLSTFFYFTPSLFIERGKGWVFEVNIY